MQKVHCHGVMKAAAIAIKRAEELWIYGNDNNKY